ncbi:hypothetical protein LWI29_035963 [Acer saccharum]|uniref:Cystatin domain-containing protein n=1 Tax=Acer saccharum TaxID=4024 RepID=A0AA39TU66_ACESA|nr:hypothetical protein LWI29_035963 [Acer saccharum]KAK1591601.1 hypothetical protein Q3G72_010204 [Acer saccharum]
MGKLIFIVSVSVLSLCTVIASVSGYDGKVGGRTEVEDVKKNKQVQEVGRFSVEEFNRREMRRGGGTNNVYGELMFAEVTEAEKQVVSGIKYYMKIEVGTKSGETKIFDSVVVLKPWLHSKQLLNFSPSN